MVAGFGEFMGTLGIRDIYGLVIPRFEASLKAHTSSSSGAPAPRGAIQKRGEKGGKDTASIEAFNAAKNMASMYGAFFKTVAQEIGMDRAIALQRKVGETFGPEMAEMLKEPDLNKLASQINEMNTRSGTIAEINVEPTKIVTKVLKCPFYEGLKAAGIGHEEIRACCQYMSEGTYDSLRNILPNITGSILRFRSSADELCIEEIQVKK